MLTLPALAGCFRVTRTVAKAHPPPVILSEPIDALVQNSKAHYEQIKTLNASVTISASTGGSKEGKVTDVTGFSGYILMRQPDDLHVLLFVPIAHIRALDMVSNHDSFKMAIPPRNRYITGSNTVTKPSKNPLENLRPSVFTDSLLIRGIEDGQYVTVTSDERIYKADPKAHDLVAEPTYELTYTELMPNSHTLRTLRTVHYGRANLRPFQQEIYDADGQLDTQSTYENYQRFGNVDFPSKVTINRPKDQLSMTVVINKLSVNQTLEDDQFELKFPNGAKVETLQ